MNHDEALAALATTGGWRKSGYSQGANGCVEVTAELPGWVGVRDSKLGACSPLLPVSTAQWTAFLEAILA